MYKIQTIAVIIPALDEEKSIALVVADLVALRNTDNTAIVDDIIVCDNASSDNTAKLAQKAGARIVYESRQGYGAACLKAIEAVQEPDVIVFVDADRSVVAKELVLLLDAIIVGNDLVIGSRVLGHERGLIAAGAITPQQRFGNMLASYLMQCIWRQKVTDLGPFRAIRYSSLQKINMVDQRYGWTVEMQVKAIQSGLSVAEVAVSSLKRIGHSKISGTLLGTLRASYDILSTILYLWWKENKKVLTTITK